MGLVEVNYADHSNWDSDQETVLRILDPFMAFDTIHHTILLCWLRVLGMRDTILQYFSSSKYTSSGIGGRGAVKSQSLLHTVVVPSPPPPPSFSISKRSL